jgi:hypothetical protein
MHRRDLTKCLSRLPTTVERQRILVQARPKFESPFNEHAVFSDPNEPIKILIKAIHLPAPDAPAF